ncbi:MAG TPA: dihydrodipicolinate synthase family protein [Verrucomicrobiae bacterium]|nr:dihydrodipicolinate synthase family protein [Verrucomicrobiae bacterium]
MKYQRLTGLVAAPFTPFHQDGSLDVGRVAEQAERLIADGVAGAFVCGTTGEGPSMNVEERIRLTEGWIAAAGARLRIIVHVGHSCLADCQTLAAHAQRAGATGIGCLAPYFFKPRSVGDLVGFCAKVASAAPDLPFYYYHLPSVTGVNFPMVEFLAAAAERIPNLAGIKFTSEDLMDYSACGRFDGGRFDILFGRDEILLAGLALGAKGAIGSTYNYMAPIYHALIGAFERGDIAAARAAQARAADIIAVMLRHGGLAAGKAIMALVGFDCGPVRPPLHDLGPEQRESLRRELETLAFPIQS